MSNNVDLLQKTLLKTHWDNASEVISYIMKISPTPISAKEIKDLKLLAETQLKYNVPLKYFI